MSQPQGGRGDREGPGQLLGERRSVEIPLFRRIGGKQFVDLASPVFEEVAKLQGTPIMTLSCRHPWDDAHGNIDVYHPGRWDTTSDLIYMSPIHSTGPSPGEWDGTVIYGMFNAPANGDYLVVGHFSGYDTTMSLNGPWGTTTAHTAQTSDPGTVLASWTGSGALWFTISCTGLYGGYMGAIEVY